MMPKVIGNDSLIARVNEVQGVMYRQSNELGRLNRAVKKYKDDNVKLRELVRIMHGELVSCEDNGYVCGGHKFDDRMRELGIEVKE